MRKSVSKLFSVIGIFILAFSFVPAGIVVADWPEKGTVTGNIYGLPENMQGRMYVDAVYVDGSYNNFSGCLSDWIVWNTDHYEYSASGCYVGLKLQVTVDQYDGINFIPVNVTIDADPSDHDLVETAPDLYPVSRAVTGSVHTLEGLSLDGVNVRYEIYDFYGATLIASGDLATADGGYYTVPGMTDANKLHLHAGLDRSIDSSYDDRQDYDGYEIEKNDVWFTPPYPQDLSFDFISKGTRELSGWVETNNQNQTCRVGVTINAYIGADRTNPLQTTATLSDGSFNFSKLLPREDYTFIPSKSGCVYTPDRYENFSLLNGNQSLMKFTVPDTGIWGKITLNGLGTLDKSAYPTLAYYLLATYTSSTGISYTTSINWVDGSYYLALPPNVNGTLVISRIGGSGTAFGYDATTATVKNITLTNEWKEINVELTPTRTITGAIVGQNSVPIQRDATVDFGYWLRWTQPGTTTAYTLKAQPKVYYLSPVESGILSSTPTRFLANTTAGNVTGANFTLNLKTYTVNYCISSATDGRDSLALPETAVRFRPASGYGTATYPSTRTLDGCGPNINLYTMTVPKGIVGTVEADYHTLQGSITVVGLADNISNGAVAYGDRTITGRMTMANPNIKPNWCGDYYGADMLVLRDAATNQSVDKVGQLEASREFTFGSLERKSYTLTWNPACGESWWGYTTNNATDIPQITTVNLTSGNADLPGSFVLTHTPIDRTKATGGGYFTTTNASTSTKLDATQEVQWTWPTTYWENDDIQYFELQVGSSTVAFSDTSPIVKTFYPSNSNTDYDNGPISTYKFTGLANGVYKWRVRAVFVYDKGPWMDLAPVPTSPTAWEKFTGPAANITFYWNALTIPSTSAYRYMVQYSDSPTFATVTGTLATANGAATSVATTAIPPVGKAYFWHVKAQYNNAGTWTDITPWSPTQAFTNRFSDVTLGTTEFERATFDGYNPEPVRFYASDPNKNAQAAVYYEVHFSTDPTFDTYIDSNSDGVDDTYLWGDWNVRVFPKTVSVAASPWQYLDTLPSGEYYWRIRMVYGNDYSAPPLTDWTVGSSTITVP